MGCELMDCSPEGQPEFVALQSNFLASCHVTFVELSTQVPATYGRCAVHVPKIFRHQMHTGGRNDSVTGHIGHRVITENAFCASSMYLCRSYSTGCCRNIQRSGSDRAHELHGVFMNKSITANGASASGFTKKRRMCLADK